MKIELKPEEEVSEKNNSNLIANVRPNFLGYLV